MDNVRLAFAVLLAAVTITNITAQKCWQCTAEIRATTDLTKQHPCVTGQFPAEKVNQMDCPEGRCIVYTSVISGEPPYLSRGCLTKRKQQKNMCKGGEGLKDVSCCTGDLCNESPSGSTVKIATIFLITISALTTILHVFD